METMRIWLKASGISQLINKSDFNSAIHSTENPKELKKKFEEKVEIVANKEAEFEKLEDEKAKIEKKTTKKSKSKRVSKRVKADPDF